MNDCDMKKYLTNSNFFPENKKSDFENFSQLENID